jgi:hypothetical protein
MQMGSKRNMVLIGFVLSLVSITFNSVVIAYVNGRLKEVDGERTRLLDSLDRQATTQSDGDAQFAIYRVLHNLAFAVPNAKGQDVDNDAISQLQIALDTMYQASYDIPRIEMEKVKDEDDALTKPFDEQFMELDRKREAASSEEEMGRLQQQHDDLLKKVPPATSDIARKLREIDDLADKAESSGNLGKRYSEAAVFTTLQPLMNEFRDKAAESNKRKRSRIAELEDERSSLVTKSNYASYGAIAFQLIGLMFILAKDLLSHKKAA